jgi:hypothetical protein
MNRYIPERIKWYIVTWCDEGLVAIKIKKKLSSVFGPGRTYALSTINKICKKWREEGTIKRSRGQGAPRRARSLRNINEVRAELVKDIRIRSPKKTPRRIARALHISKSSVHRIIKLDLKLKPFKKVSAHKLSANDKHTRLIRCQELLRRFSVQGVRRICFSDESVFPIDGYLNKQNTRIYAKKKSDISDYEILNQRSKFPASLMVWFGVCYNGKLPPIFLENGLRLNANIYQQTILTPAIESANDLFLHRNWTFQQDSAPAHGAAST